MKNLFRHISNWVSEIVGSPYAFALAASVIFAWAFTGPLFNFSDTWQLIINTSTTIITFLMVFLIQNTQNRENKAMHIKIDELLRSVKNASNKLINAENFTDEELANLEKHFQEVASGRR